MVMDRASVTDTRETAALKVGSGGGYRGCLCGLRRGLRLNAAGRDEVGDVRPAERRWARLGRSGAVCAAREVPMAVPAV
jgi:hypothetical protein